MRVDVEFPAEDGVMSRPHIPEGAAMDGLGRDPSRQRGCHHAAGERARLAEQDADLYVRHAVPVEHDVAASPVDPACVQALPHLAEKLAPQCGEVLPRRPGGNHSRRARFELGEGIRPGTIAR